MSEDEFDAPTRVEPSPDQEPTTNELVSPEEEFDAPTRVDEVSGSATRVAKPGKPSGAPPGKPPGGKPPGTKPTEASRSKPPPAPSGLRGELQPSERTVTVPAARVPSAGASTGKPELGAGAGTALSLDKTLARPLAPPEAEDGATVVRASPEAAPPRETAPPEHAPARPAPRAAKKQFYLSTAALLGLLSVAGGGVLVWWVFDEPEVVLPTLRVEPANVTLPPEASAEPPPLPPLAGPVPSLPQAAELAATGRWLEAAQAYEALAQQRPNEPGLAATAQVLRAKAQRRPR